MNNHDTNLLSERNDGKEFFKYLIKIALADGIIDDTEEKVLHRAGKKFGFTDPEIDSMLSSAIESSYHPPYELEKRFHQLYSIVQLITADEEIHDDELKFAKYFALASGFEPSNTEKIIQFILKGIEDGIDEEDLFVKFRKEMK